MPSRPWCCWSTSTSSMVTATRLLPVLGWIRVTRRPARSVTQSMSSGPHVTSHGPSSPLASTRVANAFVVTTLSSSRAPRTFSRSRLSERSELGCSVPSLAMGTQAPVVSSAVKSVAFIASSLKTDLSRLHRASVPLDSEQLTRWCNSYARPHCSRLGPRANRGRRNFPLSSYASTARRASPECQ